MTSLPSQPEKRMWAKSAWIKRKTVALPLLCMIIFGIIISSRLIGNTTSASAASLVPLTGHVPSLVKNSTLVGPADPSQNLSISIDLKLRNAEALKVYADNTIHSRSTKKPQHLTQAQVTEAFAPLASSQQTVIDYLQGYGFTVTMTLSQHLVIGFKGTISDAENAFHIQIDNYRSSKGKNFYAPASDPQVPSSLAGLIQNISGLDNAVTLTHPPVTKRSPSGQSTSNALTSNAVTCRTAAPGQPLLPSQVATAYNFNGFYNAGFKGEGQTIALVELDDYNLSDVKAYTGCYGGGSVPINKILVDGGNGGTGSPPSVNAFEDEMDMELILGMAPHLAGLNVYEAPRSLQGLHDIFAQIINNAAIPVISTSWGICESKAGSSYLNAENNLFMLAAAQGQTIFAASGDRGTNDCGDTPQPGQPPIQPSVDDPASQPYVTGVGGTTLGLNGDNTYNSESVWYTPGTPALSSGGGLSSVWSQPSWQQGPGVNNSYSNGKREVPDVALDADWNNSGYLVYCTVAASCSGYTWWYGGGTSAGAPLWAAMMALTNQKSLHDGGFNVGFINPLLYQVGQSANGTLYSNDFHDVTTGNNDTIDSTGQYPATANYDMTTGLGSFNAWNLGQDLETLATAQSGSRQAPANTTWYFAEGAVGGSYKEYITILNPSITNANVTVQYFFPNKAPVTISHVAPANLRSTISVNTDLGVSPTGTLQAHSTLVTSSVPVVVERPMYFNVYGVPGGTDVQGTNSTATSFYFAAGDARASSSATSHQVIALLNPTSTAANVTVNYYSGGTLVESDPVTLPAQSRGTATPTKHVQAAIQVTSDQPIVAERTEYFSGTVQTAGGLTTGASSTMGVTSQGTDWLFAEGYTGTNFQENLVLGNVSSTATTATIKLEYTNGTVQTVSNVAVPAMSQVIFDVNNANGHPNCSPTSTPSCTVSNSVSIEVTSANPIVAERVQYFHFGLNGHSYPGMDDTVGQPGPASQTTYSFSEGSCGTNFLDWLTLQNPNGGNVVAVITVFADNTIVQKQITLHAHSRTSMLLCDIVNPLANAYPNSAGYTVSADVQSIGGPIAVERPLYFSFSGSTGASSIFGYTGH
ncbi:S53 family peptidase [Ktedonobacter racemifer]|uniref:Peptidase S53 propeptide n=1 Tax=Ktedonobacter racemifer DSM 44963 TaxID=485913 RepID=D6TBT9_KTERA|nr:S53 family peptidase [Ktedonobacter racemifer]EFH89871.1 Peptidase S53 propeptide [Ktedonobacter racemifer DSM 44963]